MKIIGVTGGVGAGKSTVLDYLKEIYHAHLILADLVGHGSHGAGASGLRCDYRNLWQRDSE